MAATDIASRPLWSTRMTQSPTRDGRPYYTKELLSPCDCPHCPTGKHWTGTAGSSDRAKIEAML